MTNFFDDLQNSIQYRFLKFPLALLFEPMYASVTNDAKLLFALMLDRTSLSVKHRWYDKQGRLYIYFTIKEIETTLQCSQKKPCECWTSWKGCS